MPSRLYIQNPLFPYTLDDGFDRYSDCQIQPCPVLGENFPGFWTVPMIDYQTKYYDEQWSMNFFFNINKGLPP